MNRAIILIGLLLIASTPAMSAGFRDYTQETTPIGTDLLVMQQADNSATNFLEFDDLVANFLAVTFYSKTATDLLLDDKANTTGISFNATALTDMNINSNPILSATPTVKTEQGYTAAAVDTAVATKSAVIFQGTQALGTVSIADGACATAIDVTATGVLTTDVISIGYNSTPIGKTGYDPTAGAELSIRAYPTAGHIFALVCNRTGADLIPSAMTLNLQAVR